MNIWTVKEAAEWLKISYKTLYDWLGKDELKGLHYKRVGSGKKARYIITKELFMDYFTKPSAEIESLSAKAIGQARKLRAV